MRLILPIFFLHSAKEFAFKMTFEYKYEKSHRAVLHSLDYDVNIEIHVQQTLPLKNPSDATLSSLSNSVFSRWCPRWLPLYAI